MRERKRGGHHGVCPRKSSAHWFDPLVVRPIHVLRHVDGDVIVADERELNTRMCQMT